MRVIIQHVPYGVLSGSRRRSNLKPRRLAVVLIGCFVLTSCMLRSDQPDWYQGQQGHWQQQGNNWQWRGTQGDDWYQGRQGHWYQEHDGWQYRADDGDEYRQAPPNRWQGQRQK